MAIQVVDKVPERRDRRSSAQDADTAHRLWWTAQKGDAAGRLMAWARAIEETAWPRRFANLTYFRYMTGRPVNPSFNFSMVTRPSSVVANYGRAVFRPPVFNAMAQADDVLANRVYKSRPFVQVCPIAGDFGARVRAKKLTRWNDAAFYELGVYELGELCGQDSRCYGDGYLKVDVGLDDKPALTRICDDELLVDETECAVSDEPRTLGVRIFLNRSEVMEKWGADDESKEAIRHAPSASLGFYFGSDLDVSDVIVLVEAWHLSPLDSKGRHVVAVGDYALVDERYKRDHFPIAKLPYRRLSAGWRSQGLAEQLLPLQRELERWCASVSENVQRVSWPRLGIESGSAVNEAALAAKSGGTFRYTRTMPEQLLLTAITPDQFQWGETLVKFIRERAGISDQAAAGVKPAGLNSGLAIEKQAQLDDGRHVELSQHLEDFYRQVSVLLIESGEDCKPTVTLPGRRAQQIKWADVNMAASSYWLRPFPMSSLPQSIAGRQQIIDTWAAEGRISKATQARLEQLPDVDGYLDAANAAGDWVEATLDEIVEDGTYNPPTPFADLQDQLAAVQSRYCFEDKQGDTPRDRLDMLLQFWAATQELIEEAAPPPAPAMPPGAPMPGGPGFGIQPPSVGPALPLQVNPLQPAMPAPTPLAA